LTKSIIYIIIVRCVFFATWCLMTDTQQNSGFILATYKTGKIRYFYEAGVHSLEEANDFSRWSNFDPSFSVGEEGGTIVAFIALPYYQGDVCFDVLRALLLNDAHCTFSEFIDLLANTACEHKPAP
jgi:hypothetical protein